MTKTHKIKTLSALLIGALMLPAVQAADVVMPKALPAYAADKALPVPAITKQTLDNGLTVWVVPRDGTPRVDFVLAFRDAGLAADPADMPGFAGALAGLLSEGTAKRDSRAIAETAQGFGGSIGGGASNDGLTLFADALPSRAGDMLSLLAEVARSPSFPEQEVALAKANALQGLKASEAQPGFRAERAILKAVYGDHPYARTQNTEAGIAAISRDKLVAAHQARLRPDRALLVVAGRISPKAAFDLAKQSFGDWQVDGKAAVTTPASATTAQPSFVHLERAGSVQSALRVGRPSVPATHADHVSLRVASTVLGGGFSSRLMQNLREDKGYTYGASLNHRAQLVGGALVTGADVRNEVTGAALDEVMKEYTRLGSEPVSATELDMNKRYLAGGYLISNQMQGAVAGTLAANWLVGLPPEYLGEYVPKVRAVTAEQVQAMGRKYFDPAQQSIIVVGDAAVTSQLGKFGKFDTAK